MILSFLIAIPIAGALLLALMPRTSAGAQLNARVVALGVSLITLVVSLVALARFDLDAG